MAAYVIVQADVTDEEKYGAYTKLSPATVEKFGGRFVVRGGEREDLEGRLAVSRVVVLEFPSMDVARSWYRSPEYQEAKAARAGAATATFTLVDGV